MPANIAVWTTAMITGLGADHGETENAIAVRLDQRLHEASRLRYRPRCSASKRPTLSPFSELTANRLEFCASRRWLLG
jgi:hypothetical protein